MRRSRIAVTSGDGIGIEVIEAGTRVLHVLQDREPRLELQFETFPLDPKHEEKGIEE